MPSESFTLAGLPLDQWPFYAALLFISLAFTWVGVALTLRRLRAIGLPLWLVTFFFLPVVNLFFFLLLSVIPSRTDNVPISERSGGFRSLLGRILPDHPVGSAAMGIAVTILFAVLATQFSVRMLENYGWGLFVGIPFFLGLTSVLIYGFHRQRSFGTCLAVSLCAVALFALALMAFAIEGAICIVMAAPLGAALALIGSVIGYVIQRRPDHQAQSPALYCVLFLAVPFVMGVERIDPPSPELVAVRTSVEINAPPEVVWAHVVSFTELPPPEDWVFLTGIAYPMRAEIRGQGVGAVRHCVFSTGAFVEPIEVWDEPRLLRFSVTAQPPAMRELSPYGIVETPHLNDYLVSQKGQFLLTRLPGDRTRLEGTTWYEVRIWPQNYWQVWSDGIIHAIHGRVLDHVKNLSEREAG